MTHLIDKDVLVAEIRKRLLPVIRDKHYDEYEEGQDSERIAILSIIDTLDVKEVDLEKELETLDSLLYDLDGVAVKGTTSYLTVEDVKDIAKHFFELGLKA